MANAKSDVTIENENLFRALVFGPIAILFVLFGGQFLMSSGIVLFKVIYVVMALYFTLCALAHIAYYTNEVYEGRTESFIKNENLLKTLINVPLAIVFCLVAANSIVSSGHIVFNVISSVMAAYFTLSALAYAAFYTNDYSSQESHSV